jgi:hypothetical protein
MADKPLLNQMKTMTSKSPSITPLPKTRVSPLNTKAREEQAKRAKAFQDRNNPAKMTPAQKAAYLANSGRDNY